MGKEKCRMKRTKMTRTFVSSFLMALMAVSSAFSPMASYQKPVRVSALGDDDEYENIDSQVTEDDEEIEEEDQGNVVVDESNPDAEPKDAPEEGDKVTITLNVVGNGSVRLSTADVGENDPDKDGAFSAMSDLVKEYPELASYNGKTVTNGMTISLPAYGYMGFEATPANPTTDSFVWVEGSEVLDPEDIVEPSDYADGKAIDYIPAGVKSSTVTMYFLPKAQLLSESFLDDDTTGSNAVKNEDDTSGSGYEKPSNQYESIVDAGGSSTVKGLPKKGATYKGSATVVKVVHKKNGRLKYAKLKLTSGKLKGKTITTYCSLPHAASPATSGTGKSYYYTARVTSVSSSTGKVAYSISFRNKKLPGKRNSAGKYIRHTGYQSLKGSYHTKKHAAAGDLILKKVGTHPETTKGNDMYDLDGAQFEVTGPVGNKNEKTYNVQIRNGKAVISGLPVGVYKIKEIYAPKGYVLSTKKYKVTVKSDKTITAPIKNNEAYGKIDLRFRKLSEPGEETNLGDAKTVGTEMKVKFYPGNYRENELASMDDSKIRTWTFASKADNQKLQEQDFSEITFNKEHLVKDKSDPIFEVDGKMVMPLGTYTIEESKANDTMTDNGELLNADDTVLTKEIKKPYYFQIRQASAGSENATYTYAMESKQQDLTGHDWPKYFGIRVYKYDKELQKSEAIGGKDHKESEFGTTLEGVSFNIINRSRHRVYKLDPTTGKRVKGTPKEIYANPGEVVTTITTKWNDKLKAYVAETGNTRDDGVPYGTYEVVEVKTSTGYLLNNFKQTVICKESDKDGKIHELKEATGSYNQVIRGDLKFNKRLDDDEQGIKTAFVLTNVTTGEQHVLVTDKNGAFNTKDLKASVNTNKNDAVLKGYDETKTVIKEKDLDEDAGVWFGLGEDKSMAKVSDTLRPLPYGKYTYQELRTDTNKDHDLVKGNIYVSKDGKLVDYGTMDDTAVVIHTTAYYGDTNSHMGAANKEVTIRDVVTYEGLKKNAEYVMKGVLYNKKTGAPILDKDGKEITTEKKFRTDSVNGKVEVEFTFDASNLTGTSVVVFEECLDAKGTIIGTHKDINDEGQTVEFTDLKTKALDKTTGTNITKADEKMTIVDTVTYSKLKAGKTYTVTGTLMDKETGKAALDDKGSKITAETSFKAEKSEGSVEVVFEFSGVNLAGKTLVAFETVSYQGVVYGVHADINDEDQTIYVPEIKTTAKDNKTNDHISLAEEEATIVDTVTYKNLVVGKEYTMTGTLMNKETGKPLLVNDKEVVSEPVTFKAEKSDGSVDIIFKFNAKGLEGTTTVAFETLTFADKVIATHADIEDEGQTVEIPKIQTEAIGKDSESKNVLADKEVTIVDKVSYSHLIPGKEYTMTGTLMGKETGKPLAVNGQIITSTKAFTPETSEGVVEIEFVFDATGLEGKTYVAFEECKYMDKPVGVHTDIEDEAQTVYIPKIGTTATVDGKHEATAKGTVTLIDKIAYENLMVGETYVAKGVLVDKSTGEPLLIGGAKIEVEKEFKAETANGSVEVPFEFDASGLGGKSLVVFEEVSLNGKVIGVHKDVNDENQTVKFTKPKEKTPKNPKTPTTPSTPSRTPRTPSSPTPSRSPSIVPSIVKTGDSMKIIGFALAVIAFIGAAIFFSRKKKD